MSQRIALCGADAHRSYAGHRRETRGKRNTNDKTIPAGLESTSPGLSCVYSLKCAGVFVFLKAVLFPVLRPVSMETG